jgi:hypothetical protein
MNSYVCIAFAGAKVIGLEEMEAVSCALGMPSFPRGAIDFIKYLIIHTLCIALQLHISSLFFNRLSRYLSWAYILARC